MKSKAALVLFLVIIGFLMPFAYIWAWNTLFSSILTIPTNFYTWLAVGLLTGLYRVKFNSP